MGGASGNRCRDVKHELFTRRYGETDMSSATRQNGTDAPELEIFQYAALDPAIVRAVQRVFYQHRPITGKGALHRWSDFKNREIVSTAAVKLHSTLRKPLGIITENRALIRHRDIPGRHRQEKTR